MGLFRTKQTIEPDAVPTTVEEAIPVQDFYEDGIALVGRGLWSKTFRFSDINYATASRERKEELFLGYSDILNSFDAGAMTKITVCNRRQSQSRFEKQNLLPLRGDRLDRYRDEYNRMLTENAEQSSGITQNVEDLLQSHTARTMLANSELVVMLNQAATDRAELAALMGISDAQMSYITNAEAGHGLVKIGGALVPFVNRMKKGTELYFLCTTKPGEC